MNGFEKLQSQMENQNDPALKQVIEYLLSRKDMEPNYLKEEKTVEGMCDFIQKKGIKQIKSSWNYISDSLVYSWAIMYFSLPNSFLGIVDKEGTTKKSTDAQKSNHKNNVVSLQDSKKKIEEKSQKQLSLFGGTEE